VDTEAERAALDVIRGRFPGHAVLAEEMSASSGPVASPPLDERTPLWIVDPLDGTTNYLHGHPMYAASIGVAVGGEVVAGAIVAPATGERWWAAKGSGSFRSGERIRTSPVHELAKALLGTGFPFRRPHELPAYLEEFRRVFGACSGIRRAGSAALDFCYLAQGSLDAFWEGNLAPWDVAAGRVILEEAGGSATRRDGSPIDLVQPGTILAANSVELLRALGAVLDG
jgi:myo-inositol-1(or 4)-monophosphatase